MMNGGSTQAVIFNLDAEAFALPVGAVREILDHRPAFRVPQGPPWMKGLIDVRGETLPLIDLRMRLGLEEVEPGPPTRVLIVDAPVSGQMRAFGLIVDKVADVSTFMTAEIEASPDLGVRWRSDYIDGIVRRPSGFIVLLALTSLFSNDDEAFVSGHLEAA